WRVRAREAAFSTSQRCPPTIHETLARRVVSQATRRRNDPLETTMLDNPTPHPDLDTSIGFLSALRERGPWNLTAIVPDGPIHSATFTDGAKMRGWLERHVGHANLHYSANPASTPSGVGGR